MTEIITKPFNLTMADYRGLFVHSLIRSLLGFPLGLIWLINTLVLPYQFSARQIENGDWSAFALWVSVIAVFWLVVLPLLSIMSMQKQLKKTTNAMTTRAVHLTENYISFKGDDFEHTMNWQSVKRVIEGRSAIYLMSKGQTGYVILKSALKSPNDSREIMALAKRQIANAKQKKIAVFENSICDFNTLNGMQSPSFRLTFPRFLVLYLNQFYAIFLTPSVLLVLAAVALGPVLWEHRLEAFSGQWDAHNWLDHLQPLLWGLIAILVAAPVLSPVSWLYAKRVPAFQGERRVALTPNAIEMEAPSFSTRLPWTNVKVRRQFDMMLFFVSPRGAILVPCSIFTDKAAAQAFYDQALAYSNAAKTPAAKSTLDG